mgnify:FL=1
MTQPKITIKTPAQFIASGFGSGCAPVAPGTFGTLAALPFWVGLTFLPLWVYLLVIVVASLFGFYICQKASDELGVHDHGGIVWDEFVGLWITMIAIPFSVTNMVIGFILFRIFDIIKPWPIRVADQKVGGGVGIMIDDMIAGVIACGVFHLLRLYVPIPGLL